MIEEYRISADAIPHYELEILKSGICSALVPGSYYSENDIVVIIPDSSNYSSFSEKIGRSGGEILDSFRLTMKMLRCTIEACIICQDYLIRPEDISLSVDDLFFSDQLNAGLLLKPDSGGEKLLERIILLIAEIASRYPQSNAEVIMEKIEEFKSKEGLNENKLLRLLSLWELELER